MKRDLPAPEQIVGMDEPLPAGERLLWQGAPRWQSLARHALHVRKVALYFAVLAGWKFAASLGEGAGGTTALVGAAWLLALGAAAIGVLTAIAWGMQRTTIYAVTSERVLMRIGIALPMTLNLPLAQIDGAGLRMRRDGSGDIALALRAGQRIGWLYLWPHARAWRIAQPEPQLRGLGEPLLVADIVARALAEAAATTPVRVAAPASSTPPPRALHAQAA